jgi:hypothetical protein
MPMVILLRARHGQLTDWSVSPATWPIELPPLPETQATVSTAPQIPVVAANPTQLNSAPTTVPTNSATSQATAAPSTPAMPVSVAPVSSNTPSTEINQASIVSTPSAKALPQTNATASPIANAPTQNPIPQTTKASSPPAPPNTGASIPTQVQVAETASTTTAAPSARPASGVASQTPPPVQSPPTLPASAQAVPLPNGPLSTASAPPSSNSPVQHLQPVADKLSANATSIANTSVADSQPSPSLPPQTKPAAIPFSPTPSSNNVVETGLWITLIVVSAVGAIYFIWGWLATYFRPRTPERIILQPRSTSPQIGPPASASTPKATYPPTPQIVDRKHPAPTAHSIPQKKETVQ